MEKDRRKDVNPVATSNPLYYVLYGWVYKFFSTGYKRDIELHDFYEPLSEHSAGNLGDQFSKVWDKYLKQGRPSLLKTILTCFKNKIITYLVVYLIIECVVRMSQPTFVGKLVSYYIPDQTEVSKECLYYYGIGIILCSLILICMSHPCALSIGNMSMKLRIGCSALIYRKALRLSKVALANTTIGEIVNLLTNDVSRFDFSVILLLQLVGAPVQIIVMAVLVWVKIGPSALIGVIFLVMIIPFQLWLGKKASALRTQTAKMTDNRLRLINEIILGIHVIKMYTWELPFSNLMEKARRIEINNIKHSSYIRGIVMSFGMFNTRIAIFVSLLSYFLFGNELTAEKVFIIVSYYGIMKQSLTILFPQAITMSAELLVVIDRIQTFLLYKETGYEEITDTDSELGFELETFKIPENDSDADDEEDEMKISFLKGNAVQEMTIKWDVEEQNLSYESDSNENLTPSEVEDINTKDDVENPITMRNVNVKWVQNQNHYTINNINLNVKPGTLVAIVGAVGSGKTTIFHTILKEVFNHIGVLRTNGTISYASQEPWIFNSTIKHNITFGTAVNDERYKKVIEICGLKRDITLFAHKDDSIVGERGITLSGGQKARINLARAIYREADIYLLDDPLSAVDVHIGRQIFDDCVMGYLCDKTRLLITHQLQYLTNADHIIILDEGYVVGEGKYEYLLKTNSHFKRLIQAQSETQKSNIDESLNDDRYIHKKNEDKNYISRETNSDRKHIVEGQNSGKVGGRVYMSYITSCGSIHLFFLLISLITMTQFFASGSDMWISKWVNEVEGFKYFVSNLNYTENQINDTFVDVESKIEIPSKSNFIIIVYSVLIIFLIFATLGRSIMFFWMSMRASMSLHNNMFKSISHAIMRFFYDNPSGRILNRFSKDMGSIDELLPIITLDVIQSFQQLCGIIIVVIIINPWLLILVIPIAIIFVYLRSYYLATSRSLKRLDGITRSPIFTHLGATLQGMTTIRAFSAENIAIEEFNTHQDLHSSVWFIIVGTTRCLALWLDLGSVVFIAFVTLSFIVFGQNFLSGNVGLAITQAVALTGMIQWGIRQSTEMENIMTCVERVLEYHDVDQEHPLEMEKDKLLKNWPAKGNINFQNVSLRYSPKGIAVISDVSFKLQSGEKLGIVGRTGSGKTSIVNALFRMAYVEGTMEIDKINTGSIGLNKLRSNISIIPQDPILFSGTIRLNLDPFDEYPDDVLWKALEQVELKNEISNLSEGLDSNMAEGGSNFSIGQRQLFCLARAIIRKNQILVLDEATANVDPHTDKLIQTTIRKEFSSCTVLTIAHRLQTIMDSDKVLVMDNGKVIEFDSPYMLIQNKGTFAGMVHQTNKETSKDLIKTAKECHEARLLKQTE